ncbi:MAG: quinone-dependent dihydroorotate dehydrogenase [Imperialibacter sp.]|uniref:quinone-dependent dihydroorotate dehydrogenase n=1 Tax=Imperialibacter sp. TaxID=2038411 RepID=UPI0032EDCFD2
MYKALIKPLFFLLSPEKAHYLAMDLLSFACKMPGGKWLLSTLFRYKRPSLEKEVFGIKFPNPVGLAAGFDKDAWWIDSLDALGFGFIEIGTLTPKAQEGNPKPRLFRLPEDESLINRMGFNNQGVDAAVARLRQRKSKVIVGGNIGKNKVTPNEKAVDDYAINFLKLFDVVDYFVVNVSSPNTPNLRALQEKEPLKELLSGLQTMNLAKPAPKPILLKIAPDLTNSQLDDVVEIVTETGIAGIIATNTTISREGLITDQQKVKQIGAGGLSGKVLKERSTEVIRYLHTKTNGGIPIIGVGGISTAADAKEKLDAGASLVQVYSAFIYEGPAIVKNILKQL